MATAQGANPEPLQRSYDMQGKETPDAAQGDSCVRDPVTSTRDRQRHLRAARARERARVLFGGGPVTPSRVGDCLFDAIAQLDAAIALLPPHQRDLIRKARASFDGIRSACDIASMPDAPAWTRWPP